MCKHNEPAVTAGDYAHSVSLSSSMVYASTLLSVCCCKAAHNGERVASCRALGARPRAWQGLGSSKIRVADLLACVTRSDARGACRGEGAARWRASRATGGIIFGRCGEFFLGQQYIIGKVGENVGRAGRG